MKSVIFYVTPCAAKIASLKGAEGYSSTIKGVINMDTLYNKVYHILKNRPKKLHARMRPSALPDQEGDALEPDGRRNQTISPAAAWR